MTGHSESDHWYLAQLKSGGFERARENLARQGYVTFMPFRSKTERRGGQLKSRATPLFPGYLFVQIRPDQTNWRSINSTYGVAHLVALDRQKPTRVPTDLMDELVNRCDGEDWRPADVDIAPGQDARIVQGPFTQMIATIESMPDKDRVFVLLDLMGRATRVSVQLDDLEPL